MGVGCTVDNYSFNSKNIVVTLCFTFALVTTQFRANAQFAQFKDQIFFKQFNTEEGLSQASVNCILHDSRGFIWFGTDDGLNRFDGSDFRIFRHQPGDSSSLIGNTIQSLIEDRNGVIWVGTSEGLSRFDTNLEVFKSYALKGFEYYACVDLKFDAQHTKLWMATTINGVCYIDLASDKLFNVGDFKEISALRIEPIGNKLYIGTSDRGLLTYDLVSHAISEIALEKATSGNSYRFPIRSFALEKNILWIGTEGGGLKRLDVNTNDVKSYTTKEHHVSDDKIWSLGLLKDGRLWVGTDGGGATLLNPVTGASLSYTHSDYNKRSISGNTIRSILVDAAGDSWFGTFNGGVSYHADFDVNFLSFKHDPENSNSLSYNAVLSFCEFDDQTLMVGTDGGGLNYLTNGKFQRFVFPPPIESPNVITAIHRLANGAIVLGTYQHGLFYIRADKSIYQFKNDPADSTSISCNIIWDITEDREGNIWLATELGINRFNPRTENFTHYKNLTPKDNKDLFSDIYILSILIDSEQTLWGGQYGNLISYNFKTDKLKNFSGEDNSINTIPNKQILSIKEDPLHAGVIWFSSFGGGLVKFDGHNEKFITINQAEGLANNLIFAIQPDIHGMMWLTTNKGLILYNPIQKTSFIFDENYGVDTAPFKDNASYATKSGYIIFGGTHGFTAFKPSTIQYPKKGLKVTFTGFQFFNDEVKIDNQILKKTIGESTEIELPHDKAKFITFRFSALQFMAPSSLQYQYMLEGFENTWHNVDNKRVSFTNLFPGQYKLRIRAGFASGVWGDESMIKINVIPAWWMTTYAKLAALLAFLCLLYGIFRFRTYNLNKRKLELERIVTEQNSEIREQYIELETQNEELSQHNEELLTHRETISFQNQLLNEAQEQLKEVNQSLEGLVELRTSRLNDTISTLNKTIKELDAFLYSASHDLVAPLKSILGLVNLARLETSNNDKDMYFDHIERSVRKLEGMIHTLMQHSFNTKASTEYKSIDINTLAVECIAELQFMPESRRIKFKMELDRAEVVTDISRLKIILINLIGNAIKYSDPRKETSIVEVVFSKNETSWMLSIWDNGIGIDEERLLKVFDLFYRATESAKGSGLGLYIVKETVEKMEGKINVKSEFGMWSKFTLIFPHYRST